MRALIDGIGQKSALVKADIAGRRTNQTADAVAFHIFRHVKPLERNAKDRRQLPRDFGFTDTGRATEQIAADWLFGIAQAGTAELDGARQHFNRLVLPEHHALEICLKRAKRSLVIGRNLLWRDASNCGDNCFDFAGCDQFAAF